MFQPAGDLYLIWIQGSELNGIPNKVTPKSARGAYHQCIIFIQYNIF